MRDVLVKSLAVLTVLLAVLPCAGQTPPAQTTITEEKTLMHTEITGAQWIPSLNFDARVPPDAPVDVVVLHSTCMPTNETAETVRHLQNRASKVSSHYVVGKDGEIVQMVSETDRAWHAGRCLWEGRTDLNSCSIGIEMVHRDQDPNDTWPEAQFQAVARLLLDIRSRHRVPNDHVLFHSECADPPGRKTDPVGFDRTRLLQVVTEMAERPPNP